MKTTTSKTHTGRSADIAKPMLRSRCCAFCAMLCAMLSVLIPSKILAADKPYLVTEEGQVEGLTGATSATYDLESGGQSEATLSKRSSFTVKLLAPISLTEDKGLVVTFGRWNNEGSPKATMVEGSADGGSTWDILGYAYMQFRGGNGTIEYSKPIYANEKSAGKSYTQLRFTVLKTALGYADGDKVRFNKFNVFLLKDGEQYPDGRIDPWRLYSDYYTGYRDFKFEATRGILDERNRYGKNADYPSTTPWGENNTFTYQGRTYELPTFKMQGDNQMPHVTEHTVYAMPGEIIPLLPYYDMPHNMRYYDKFSHWYNYKKEINGEPQVQDYSHVVDSKTGERLLDFLVDPAGIYITDNAGYFSCLDFPERPSQFIIRTNKDFEDFCAVVNGGSPNTSAILGEDLDFEGEGISIGTSSNPYAGVFDGNGHTIKNLKIEGYGNDAVGLFSYVTGGAEIKNLKLVDCNVKNVGDGNTGILIGQLPDRWGSTETLKIHNIMIYGNIESSMSGSAGAVVGKVGAGIELEMTNVGFVGTINCNTESAALVGYIGNKVKLQNCYVDAFVRKIKIDSWSKSSLSAVNGSTDNMTFDNCIFNVLSLYPQNENASMYVTQTNEGVENCGYQCSVVKYDRPEDQQSMRIYIEKGNYSNFVLLFERDSWDSQKSPIIGFQGKKVIDGKEYVYFEPNMAQWDSYGYSVIPYIGDETLNEDNFWNISGMQPICQVDPAITARNSDEYVHIASKGIMSTLATNEEFSKWENDEKEYRIPTMATVDVSGLATSVDYKDKHLSNPKQEGNDYKSVEHSWYGSSATFFKPLDTSLPPDHEDNQKLGVRSYDIAADFSHEFDPTADHNLDQNNKTIYSPIINFRHIFHVVSGKDFADVNTETVDANKRYIAGKRRIVSARANKAFQVRLPSEFPVPTESGIYSSTNFYYKSGEKQYDRARGFGIEVVKDGKILDTNMFYFERDPKSESGANVSQGKRQYYKDGVTYYTAGGDDVIHRMLQCDSPQEGTYTVRLYVLDDSKQPVFIWSDATKTQKIYMMEYEITFLDGKDASFTGESSIPDLHKDSYLQQEDVCGDPVAFLDFDEYCAFEDPDTYAQDDYFLFKNTASEQSNQSQAKVFYKYNDPENPGYKSFKWPTMWSQCSYSFGYGEYMEYNYNEYIIANHASQVRYGAGAQGYNNADGTTGLYDRTYYESGGKDKGFFYYVNAASDPGVTSRLQLDHLCLGSTVVVTAWVSEFSQSQEKANVAFNFSAVLKDGTRQRLHTFVTGYIEGLPDWQHVYYSFVPVLPETVSASQVGHYELEVENNCKSSQGADYAVDDIHAYIVTPEITATQLSPICDNEETSTGVRIRTRFDKLLDAQGYSDADYDEEGIVCDFYVAIFDKAKLKATDGITIEEALRKSIVMQEDEDGKKTEWVKMTLNTKFSENENFDPTKPEQYYRKALVYETEKGVKYLLANIRPWDDKMKAGKQYYICVRLLGGDVANQKTPTLADFAVSEDDCAKYGIMTLKGSGIVKVDGFAYNDGEPINVCIGQSPVLQVELLKVSENGKQTVSQEKYYYDWFRGPLDNFSDEAYTLLERFRNIYPDVTEIPVSGRRVPGFDSLKDDEYAAIANEYKVLAQLVANDKLLLHQSSYVFPTIKSGDLYSGDQLIVTALPIIDVQKEEGEKVCAGPNEIHLNVKNSSPLMCDGFETIKYPTYMSDVPLRVGLRQLRAVTTKITQEIGEGMRVLEVPLRDISSYKEENTTASMRPRTKKTVTENEEEKEVDIDPFVYIVETNDPRYMSLTAHPGDNLEEPSLNNCIVLDAETGVLEGLLPVGKVTGMAAVMNGDDNFVKMVFAKDMQFREGYYYKLRFDFNENLDTKPEDICDGQVVFTVKVVPEYQMWTGDAGRNWNNDENWRRVAKADLFLNGESTNAGAATADHAIDDGGNNTNRMSYAPMDFTKVIVPNDVDNFPLMFERSQTEVATLQGTRNWDSVVSDAEAAHHTATKDIKYDMASWSLEDVLACRPWYANTCEQIHFQYGAELQRQQWFVYGNNYKKAWVDLETDANRWYTLATPLKQVVAGDMYTISNGAQQNTELFSDIEFNNNDYGRFDPAVYQRNWNRAGEAKIFSFGDNTGASTDAAAGISLNWSRVYNQVDVDYSGGQGFSINTRYIGENDENNDNTDNAEKTDNPVRFRLPKSDETYSYFNNEDKSEEADDNRLDFRNGVNNERHSLNSFPLSTTIKAANNSKYFLVGNPFIAQMDMAKFFEGNPGLSGKYWIMSGDRQEAYLWNGKESKFIATSVTADDNGASVAPMQGFFVEAKAETKELTVNFTADMIKVTDGTGKAQLKIAAPNAQPANLMTVTAIVEDNAVSSAVINLDADAQGAYDAAEDVLMLIDASQNAEAGVYTGASGIALAINSLDRIEETEIGVMAASDTRTTLLFEGVEGVGELKLLDRMTGAFTDLYDGMEYEVEGSAAGRLYLVSSEGGLATGDVAVVLDGRTVSALAETEGMTARVYDTVGVCLGEWTTDGCALSFDINPGIILVEVTSAGRRTTRKFIVK